ncbi:hypothetical protein IIO_04872 [Bacillus cereus VD115]|nr:hypothetical protein IIO_04872 [Bacillus cereus VD115]
MIKEKEKLSDSKLIEVFDMEWIRKNNLSPPLNKHWGNNPFHYLNAAYPGEFQDWQFCRVRKGHWNKSTGLQVLHILLKEKYKMAEEDVLQTCDTK